MFRGFDGLRPDQHQDGAQFGLAVRQLLVRQGSGLGRSK